MALRKDDTHKSQNGSKFFLFSCSKKNYNEEYQKTAKFQANTIPN